MEKIIISKKVIESSPEYIGRAAYLASLKECPFCKQLIKKPIKI
jgi:hypothetical protein